MAVNGYSTVKESEAAASDNKYDDNVFFVFFFFTPGVLFITTLSREGKRSTKNSLMSLALLFHYLILNMFRVLIHPSSGACDIFVELFHGLYCSGSMCWCYVMVWLGWCGIRMQAEAVLQPAYGYHIHTDVEH